MSKRTDVIGVAMGLFYRSNRLSKVRRSVRQIVEYLGERPVSERGPILDRMARIMGREVFAKGGEQIDLYWERHHLLGEPIGEQALATGDISYIGGYFLFPPSLQDGFEFHSARSVFVSGFYRHIGSSLPRTLQFCRLVFNALARFDERCGNLESHEVPEKDKEFILNLHTAFFASMQAPVDDQSPEKRWFIKLLEAVRDGDEEAAEYLGATLAHIDYLRSGLREFAPQEPRNEVRILSQSMFEATLSTDPEQRFKQSAVLDLRNLRIIVPDDLYETMMRFVERNRKQGSQALWRAGSFLRWFTDHASTVSEAFHWRCDEISQKPRYGYRPMGYDSFLIDVSVLRLVGITSFSLYPEGETFPNVKLSIAVQKTGPVLSQYWAAIRNFELIADDVIFLNWQEVEMQILRSLLEYIVVDALHRIIVGRRRKDLADELIERPVIPSEVTPEQRVKVRPFLRRLPIGYEASGEAQKFAFLHLGWNLPAGVTFVRSHDRWVGLPAGKPAPLFEYTDEAVRKSILRLHKDTPQQRSR